MIPFEHVVASVATLPFYSERIFGRGHQGSQNKASHLWIAAAEESQPLWQGFSVDQLLLVRDRYWIQNPNSSEIDLLQSWRTFAGDILEPQGGVAIPIVPKGYVDSSSSRSKSNSCARTLWRWITFSVPEDILLVGAWTNQLKPVVVDTIHQQLAAYMDRRGFAECHLHLGAAFRFSDLWISTVRTIGKTTTSRSQFHSPGGVFDNGKHLADWLLRASIARLVLANYLSSEDTPGISQSLARFMKSIVYRQIAVRFGNGAVACLRQSLSELSAGRLGPSLVASDAWFRTLQQIYRMLAGPAPFQNGTTCSTELLPQCESLEDFRSHDPIRNAMKRFPLANNAEMLFTWSAFEWMSKSADSNSRDPTESFDFESLFWQAFRVRNIFYRQIVLRPMIPGVPWFINSYNRIRTAASSMSDRAKLESAAEVSGIGKGLASLEVRAAQSDTLSGLTKFVQCLASASNQLIARQSDVKSLGTPLSEVALVLHFIRERGGQFQDGIANPSGKGTFADPQYDINGGQFGSFVGMRYQAFFLRAQRQTVTACRMLQLNPRLLNFVRAIDCANDESAIPLWVTIPHMKHLRSISRELTSVAIQDGHDIKPLRMTIHVGEDFVYPMTGLRRIDEAVERLGLEESDRLGHAIALGLDLREWTRVHPRILVSREDRLFDLIWERKVYRSNRLTTDANRAIFIDSQILNLARCLFHNLDDSSPELPLDDFYDLLFDIGAVAYPTGHFSQTNQSLVRGLNYPVGMGGGFRTAGDCPLGKLVRHYLTDSECFRRSQEGIWVDCAEELRTMIAMQAVLQKDIANRRLIVEVNPSSNLLVGDLRMVANHPIMRFIGGFESIHENENPIQVVVGSDDPLVFSCTLLDEFSLLQDAMVEAGHSQSMALTKIEGLLENSLAARFSLPNLY